MARVVDFRRTTNFSSERIDRCGLNVGRGVYPKLYALENLFRVLVHSILTAQLGGGWWALAVDLRIRNKVTGYQGIYTANPWHTSPGGHEIYFADLSDLLEITRANAHLFAPAVTNINGWVAKIEAVRLPRNVTAHMNFANAQDRKRIDVTYADLKVLLDSLHANTTVPLLIP